MNPESPSQSFMLAGASALTKPSDVFQISPNFENYAHNIKLRTLEWRVLFAIDGYRTVREIGSLPRARFPRSSQVSVDPSDVPPAAPKSTVTCRAVSYAMDGAKRGSGLAMFTRCHVDPFHCHSSLTLPPAVLPPNITVTRRERS